MGISFGLLEPVSLHVQAQCDLNSMTNIVITIIVVVSCVISSISIIVIIMIISSSNNVHTYRRSVIVHTCMLHCLRCYEVFCIVHYIIQGTYTLYIIQCTLYVNYRLYIIHYTLCMRGTKGVPRKGV